MTEEIGLDGERKTRSATNRKVTRSDEKNFIFAHDLTSAQVQETRTTWVNSSGTVVLQLASDTHSAQFDMVTNKQGEITFLKADTAGLTATDYSYDIEIIDLTNAHYTVERGTFTLLEDYTTDSTTAAYLSWTTRQTYDTAVDTWEAEQTAYATAIKAGKVKTAASNGAGTLDVTGAADLFSAGDDLVVELGSPRDPSSQEEHANITSAVGDTITFNGTTLGDDVAVGNVVIYKV